MDFSKDYYKILEADANSSNEELRASYRRLAKLHHPDKNPGNEKSEELFKEIAEAYEILSDPVRRHVFEEYRKSANKTATKETTSPTEPGKKTNKKTFRRTTKEFIEKRIYVRGKIVVKFWGDPLEVNSAINQNIRDYKINPTTVEVVIEQSSIYPMEPFFSAFQKEYEESEIFKTQVLQPVNCIIHTNTGTEYYKLHLHEIKIKSPVISAVTKYEGQSLGTLTADIIAYIIDVEEKETVIELEGCSGETGKQETKEEAGITYIRKEYYYQDCTTYWSIWQTLATKAAVPEEQSYQKINTTSCLQWVGLFILFFYFLLVARGIVFLFLILGVVYVAILAISLLKPVLNLLIPVCFILFCSIFLYFLSSHVSPQTFAHTSSGDSVKTKIIPGRSDSIIQHELRWADFDGKKYSATISMTLSSIERSAENHRQMDEPYFSQHGISAVYASLENFDNDNLENINKVYDSISSHNNLDEIKNAAMVVSSVQSIPYSLVLDKSCSDNYQDDFISNYLQSCRGDCCIGYRKFGVLSPMEFFGTMKGDCDTKALALYCLLKKEGYDIALLTSEYYRHALIAVHFRSQRDLNGISININNKNYFLWETTAKGYRPGMIPTTVSNLKYWNTSLLNEK